VPIVLGYGEASKAPPRVGLVGRIADLGCRSYEAETWINGSVG
jgi:hypothetical protein